MNSRQSDEKALSDKELEALISLLEDTDEEVISHVEQQLLSLGEAIIPVLERSWETQFNPIVQKRIEELIHSLHFDMMRSRLQNWLQGSNHDLLEGLWTIATYQYPDLSRDELEKQISDFVELARANVMLEDTPREQVLAMNDLIFNKLKFSANTKNFHSAANSMINLVLESKKGNPIALCSVYLLISQRLGLPIFGVNLPNLFILTYKTRETQFYVNAFNKGLIFTRSDIDNYIQHLNLSKNDIFYQPCTSLDIILRVLRNLMVSFEKTGQAEKVQEIEALISLVEAASK
jgi:regulator of sirC expression with transglutaminase-like and TPR domain